MMGVRTGVALVWGVQLVSANLVTECEVFWRAGKTCGHHNHHEDKDTDLRTTFQDVWNETECRRRCHELGKSGCCEFGSMGCFFFAEQVEFGHAAVFPRTAKALLCGTSDEMPEPTPEPETEDDEDVWEAFIEDPYANLDDPAASLVDPAANMEEDEDPADTTTNDLEDRLASLEVATNAVCTDECEAIKSRKQCLSSNHGCEWDKTCFSADPCKCHPGRSREDQDKVCEQLSDKKECLGTACAFKRKQCTGDNKRIKCDKINTLADCCGIPGCTPLVKRKDAEIVKHFCVGEFTGWP